MAVTRFLGLFVIRRPVRFGPRVPAGDYDHALHADHPEAPSLLQQYLEAQPKPDLRLGGKPMQTASSTAEGPVE